MFRRSWIVGGVAVSILAVACGGSSDASDGADNQAGAATEGPALHAVDITVSAKLTGETYEARAYPVDDVDGDGRTEYYRAPVYFVYIDGVNSAGVKERREWKAPRFMPYNNPAGERHDDGYHTVGFITAGLSSVPRFAIGHYKGEYEVHNKFSPFGGAIVVKGSFYIHAGPEDVTDVGWGSAGCVEVFGNFDHFKKDILELAGSPAASGNSAALHAGMGKLVEAGKLFVTYENAVRPNLKAALSRQVAADDADTSDADQPTDPTEPQ